MIYKAPGVPNQSSEISPEASIKELKLSHPISYHYAGNLNSFNIELILSV